MLTYYEPRKSFNKGAPEHNMIAGYIYAKIDS